MMNGSNTMACQTSTLQPNEKIMVEVNKRDGKIGFIGISFIKNHVHTYQTVIIRNAV